jgi:NitT/TauT family transport system substrate-binding protein
MLTRLLSAALVLVGTGAAVPASAQDKVAVGALRFVSNGPLFMALEKGFFKAEGLEVDIRFFDAAQPIAVAVVSGDVDLGATAFTAGLFNLAGKGALKVIAAQAKEQKGYEGNNILASNAAWEKGLRRLEDLPGRSLGITQVGSSFHYQIGQIARLKGFDLKQVDLRPLQSLGNMSAALKGGQVDAIIIAPHIARTLLAGGDGKLIGLYSELDEYQFGGLFASPKAITGRRPVVERFVRAYQKGAAEFSGALLRLDAAGKRVTDARSKEAAAMVAKYVAPGQDPAKAADTVEASTFYVDPQARLDVGDIHRQVAWFKAQGMIDANVDPAAFIDLSFVQGHTNIPR